MTAFIKKRNLKVIIFDPAYTSLLKGNTKASASNVFDMGAVLSKITRGLPGRRCYAGVRAPHGQARGHEIWPQRQPATSRTSRPNSEIWRLQGSGNLPGSGY